VRQFRIMKNKNRLGIVKISQELVHDFDLMSLVFSRFVPLSVSYDFITGIFTYKGYSPEFEEIEEGCSIPLYDCIATVAGETQICEVNFERHDDSFKIGDLVTKIKGDDLKVIIKRDEGGERENYAS